MHMKSTAVIFLALLMNACGVTQLSPDKISQFHTGKQAIVQTYNQPILATMIFEEQPITQIIAVDGKKTEDESFSLDERITVDVGLHKITFACKARGGYDERDFTKTLLLELRAYHEYSVRCSFDSAFGSDGSYTGDFSVKERRVD